MARLSRRVRLALVLGLVLAVWVLSEAGGLRGLVTLAALRDGFAHHPLLGLAGFALLFTLANLAQVPGAVFLAAAVLALGRFWGALATYIGACTACVLGFALVRSVGGDALRAFDGRVAARLFAQLEAHPVRSVFALRLLFQTLPAMNLALALSGVGWRAHGVGTLLGLPLPILAYALFFEALARWLHWPMA